MIRILLMGMLISMLGFSTEAKAEEEPSIKLRLLLQPWMQLVENGAPNGDSWGAEAYLRRARILISGKVTDRISFFVETDMPNWGKEGDWTKTFFIQDAYVDFNLVRESGFVDSLDLAFGMILLPFSHHNRQSAASLNTLDYHSVLIRFPTGSHKVWRDSGFELRGMFLNKRLDIRAGIFNGVRGEKANPSALNPRDLPRFTGRVQANLFDPEEGFFYGGNHLGAAKIVSIGFGFDAQKKALYAGSFSDEPAVDYSAVTTDLVIDFPLNRDMSAIFQGNYFHYDCGTDLQYSGSEVSMTGDAYGLEAGFRFKSWGPVISFEKFSPEYATARARAYAENLRIGVNYWLQGHSVNFKMEYARLKIRDIRDEIRSRGVLTLQTQLLF